MNYTATTSSAGTSNTGMSLNGNLVWTDVNNNIIELKASLGINDNGKIHPVLAFKYIKSKFGLMEKLTLDRRLEKLEKAIYQAIENGQEFLAEKFMKELARETRESLLYAKGVRYYIEKSDLHKYKHKIKGGHISDTDFKNYTRVIPKDVLAEKKKYEQFFDSFVIYHYYDKEVEKKLEEKQKMTPDEVSKMKDPILFGRINETDRLYFLADWEDEYCDLTFDEIVDVVGENKLTKYPEIKA